MMITSNNYTPIVNEIMMAAKEEVQRRNCNYIGTEHILLAVAKVGGPALHALNKVCATADVTESQLRKSVEKYIGFSNNESACCEEASPTLTPRVKLALEVALREMLSRGSYVDTYALLRALMAQSSSIAATVMHELQESTTVDQINNHEVEHMNWLEACQAMNNGWQVVREFWEKQGITEQCPYACPKYLYSAGDCRPIMRCDLNDRVVVYEPQTRHMLANDWKIYDANSSIKREEEA